MEKNRLDDYSIELYLGEKRSGKTLGMTAETRENIKQNPEIKVYANYHLNTKYFPNFQYITKKDLEDFYKNKAEFSNCIFLIDEIHVFMDSRRFGREGNIKIGYFLGQMGKRGNVFRGTTHFPHLVDFRLRAYCERWVYCRKGVIINKKWLMIKNNNKYLSDEENKKLYIQMRPIVRKLIDFSFQNVIESTIYIKANEYFEMYDTEELIFVEEEEE